MNNYPLSYNEGPKAAEHYGLSNLAKKDTRFYHALRFVEVECGSSLSAFGGMARMAMTAGLSASFIKNKRIRAWMRFAAAALPATRYLINEKIGDAINYLVLLEAVLKENLTKE